MKRIALNIKRIALITDLAGALTMQVAILQAQHTLALSAVRLASDMLVAVETDRGVVSSVALLRAQVKKALQALDPRAPAAEGCHPRLQRRLELVRDGEPGGAA